MMKSLTKTIFSGRSDRHPAESRSRIYSRSNAEAQPRSMQNISKHPVISILLRIDEAHQVARQAERARAELETYLGAIH